MKNISTDLKNHIAGEVTCLATCWKITRRDSQIFGFTEHDKDIVVDGVTYIASSGFTPSAVQSSASLAVDNLDIEGMLDSEFITEQDLMAGLYDFAEVEVFLVNYEDISQGKLKLKTGWLGEVRLQKNKFVAEVRSLTQKLNARVCSSYSPTCRVKFGGPECKKVLASFTFAASVSGVSSRQVFAPTGLSQANGYFNYGVVEFTSGNNAGLSMEVKDYKLGGNITLALPMPYEIEAGDDFEIITGCDKHINTCINKFNNAVNFRGEPHVPGLDAIMKTAGTR